MAKAAYESMETYTEELDADESKRRRGHEQMLQKMIRQAFPRTAILRRPQRKTTNCKRLLKQKNNAS